jgi:hypothetical protein
MMKVRLAAALMMGLVASACGGPTDPSNNVTDSFPGSVQPFSLGPVHQFNVPNLGEITVSVTAISPGNTFLGVLYGQPSGSGCGAIQQNVASSSNLGRTVLSGQIIIKGTYCLQAFDPVNATGSPLTVAQNYTIQVRHP